MKLPMILICKGTCAPVASPFRGQGGSAPVMHPVPASLGVSIAAPDRSAVTCCWMNQGKVAVRNVVAPASQPEPASRLKSAAHDVNSLRSDSRCRRYVTVLLIIPTRYLGSEKKGRVSLLWLTFSSPLSSLLLRWRQPTRAVESESRSRKDFQPKESESQKILTTPTPTPGRPFAHQLCLFVTQTCVSVTLGNLSSLTLRQEMIMAIQTAGSALTCIPSLRGHSRSAGSLRAHHATYT